MGLVFDYTSLFPSHPRPKAYLETFPTMESAMGTEGNRVEQRCLEIKGAKCHIPILQLYKSASRMLIVKMDKMRQSIRNAPTRRWREMWVVVALYALEWTRGMDFRVL